MTTTPQVPMQNELQKEMRVEQLFVNDELLSGVIKKTVDRLFILTCVVGVIAVLLVMITIKVFFL